MVSVLPQEWFHRMVAGNKHCIDPAAMLFNFGHRGKIGRGANLAAMVFQLQITTNTQLNA
jgi:hypothetical protein